MSITYDLDCGEEVITLELLDDGTLISYGFDIESEMIAKEMGFEPHPCFAAMDEALWQAAHDGNIDIVEILLAAGANVNAFDDQPLRYAAWGGHTDIVQLLLEYGANIHKRNELALRWTVIRGHSDIVELLLKSGANVHAKNDFALWWAVVKGHVDVVAILEDWIKEHG